MKRSWLALLTITVLGLLAGVAIAGRPTTVDSTVIPAATTTTGAVPTTVAATTTTVSATTTSTRPATTVAAASSTTSTPAVDRTSFRVVAANGTNTSGLAGRTADRLLTLGYTQVTPSDTLDAAAVTTIYYQPGFAAAAALVAADLQLAPTATAELTAPVSQADGDGDVIAVLGDDLPE